MGDQFCSEYVLRHLEDPGDKVLLFALMVEMNIRQINKELEAANLDSITF